MKTFLIILRVLFLLGGLAVLIVKSLIALAIGLLIAGVLLILYTTFKLGSKVGESKNNHPQE